ncbi:hypothetical protein EC988_005594, partial [Linderina pennispora]
MEPIAATEPVPAVDIATVDNLVATVSAAIKPQSGSAIDATAHKINALCDQIEELANSIVSSCQHDRVEDIGDHHSLLQASTGAFSRLRSLNRTLYEEQTS